MCLFDQSIMTIVLAADYRWQRSLLRVDPIRSSISLKIEDTWSKLAR